MMQSLSITAAGGILTRGISSRCLMPSALHLQQHFSSNQNKMASIRAADRLQGQPAIVWNEFVALANETKAVNLGMGFPNFAPPKHIVNELIEATANSGPLMNQYTRGRGHPRLVKVVAELYGHYFDRKIDPMNEVLVSIGAYGVLYYALMCHINPGDEVIIIQPSFDLYRLAVHMAGGVSKHVALKPSSNDIESAAEWKLNETELRAAFSPKTKAIIVNTPNNPLGKVVTQDEVEMIGSLCKEHGNLSFRNGVDDFMLHIGSRHCKSIFMTSFIIKKVFTHDELETIAGLCKEHDILCISDEVYEHMVYDGNKHYRIGSFPGMWERTITTYSGGKIFCATGWRLGWAIAPAPLVRNMITVHQTCVYTCPTPLQEAVARGLELELSRLDKPECFFNAIAEQLTVKRARMGSWLTQANLSPMIPEGGYFMMARIDDKGVDVSEFGDGPRDYRFVRYLMKTQGVATIPCSAFFGPENKHNGERYIRFCFIKEDETIDATGKKLVAWSKTLQK